MDTIILRSIDMIFSFKHAEIFRSHLLSEEWQKVRRQLTGVHRHEDQSKQNEMNFRLLATDREPDYDQLRNSKDWLDNQPPV